MKTLAFACIVLLWLAQPAFSAEQPRMISVSGSSTLTVKAEFALIHAQAKVVSKTVEESNVAMLSMISELGKELQAVDVGKEDFTVSVLTQGMEYDWSENKQILRGYFSACALRIKINAIGDTYRIHKVLARYPNLSVAQTVYGRNDEPQLRITALQNALKMAGEKARAMTGTLGVSLGPVLGIRESGVADVPIGRPEARLTASEAAISDPGEVSTTGSVTITGDVMVDFEIR